MIEFDQTNINPWQISEIKLDEHWTHYGFRVVIIENSGLLHAEHYDLESAAETRVLELVALLDKQIGIKK